MPTIYDYYNTGNIGYLTGASNPQQPSGSSTTTTTPGGNNYYNTLLSDPNYATMTGLLSAQSQADAAQRSAAVQKLLIQLGEVPASGFVTGPYASYYNQDVNDLTRSLAGQSTSSGLSLLARLNKQYEDARRGSINDLAARGILQSGETGYQLGELGQQKLTGEFDTRMGVLDQLNALYAGFAGAERQRQTQAALSMMDAAAAQGENPWNWGTGSQYSYPQYETAPIGAGNPGGAPPRGHNRRLAVPDGQQALARPGAIAPR